ncbi:MAG: ATP-binding protein [Anaerolineae bacterium]
MELTLILIVLVLSTVFSLSGLAIVESELLVPLAIVLIGAFLLNLMLAWLVRFDVWPGMLTWAARLGNLGFLSAGVYVTGGFRSPIFALYIVYIVIASLQYGWRGTIRSLALCLVSWIGLAIWSPPISLQGWAWAAMLAGTLLLVALTVGLLAQRHINFRREAERRDLEMTFLREAGRALGASLDPQEVLATTLARVNELLDVEAASLALVDRDTGCIEFALAIGGGEDAVEGLRLDPGEGIVGRVVQEGRSLLVPDVAADPRWYAAVDETIGYDTRSILCVPLRVKGRIIGALEALNKYDGPFAEADRRLLSSLADLAAQSIENARLHDQLQQHTRRLEEAYEEVRQLDELKSEFIRNVSHELRTPLALVDGYVELLLDGHLGLLQPEQRQSLILVAEKSSELTRMVDDIISLQSIGAMGFDMESLHLAPLARSALDDARHKAARGDIELVLDLQDTESLPPVKGDAQRLSQVLYHLLDNAIKFSPNGGTVCLSLGREGDMVCVQVRDEGVGVPTDQLERVFERFYQVDGSSTRRYGGTGLGLALVKEVVEAHGGAVWVESEGVPGRGSVFSVFLPAGPGQVAA